MSAQDEIVTVLQVACLTEDRAPEEQRAMLAVALRCDVERSKFTTTNKKPMPPSLVAEVEENYHPSEEKRAGLTKPQREQLDRLVAKWKPCDQCGAPVGAHGADGHPA